jgi:hypothetical protein
VAKLTKEGLLRRKPPPYPDDGRKMKRRTATPHYFSEGLSFSGLLLIMSHSIEISINRTLKGEWLNTRIHLLNSFM